MKTRILIILAALICSGTSVFGQSDRISDGTDFTGTFESGRYSNRYFGLMVEIPAKWSVPQKKEVAEVRSVGVQSLKTNKESVDKAFERADHTDIMLLTAMETPFGLPPTAVFTIAAQKQPNIKATPEMVLFATKKLLLASPKISLLKDIAYENVGGRRMASIEILIDTDLGGIKQRLYATVIKGYAVSIGAAYIDIRSETEVKKVLATLRFGNK